MKLTAIALLLAFTVSAHSQVIVYTGGFTNTSDASGPSWVSGSTMFQDIITNYGGAPGPSGASASSQSGFDLFSPTGGNLDISLLRWTIGPLSLTQGGDSVTVSPGIASAGFEDYRYDTLGNTAPVNLTFYYNEVEWVSGYVTRFVVEVPNNSAISATGTGTAFITANTADGLNFYNEIMAFSGNTGELAFSADSFSPVAGSDPATFSSNGQITVVPEPASFAWIAAAAVLFLVVRRKR